MKFGMGFIKEGVAWGVFLSVYMYIVNMLVKAIFPVYQNALDFGNLLVNFQTAIVPWILGVLIYGIGFVILYAVLSPYMAKVGLKIQ